MLRFEPSLKSHKIKGYENKENCPTTIEHHSFAEI